MREFACINSHTLYSAGYVRECPVCDGPVIETSKSTTLQRQQERLYGATR